MFGKYGIFFLLPSLMPSDFFLANASLMRYEINVLSISVELIHNFVFNLQSGM